MSPEHVVQNPDPDLCAGQRRQAMGRTLALVSLSQHIDLLEQFLHYYVGLGVDGFLVHINDSDGDGRIVRAAKAVMAHFPCIVTDIWPGRYDCYRKAQHDARALTDFASEDDWVLLTDLDEFQEYSMPLKDALRRSEQEGYNAIRGHVVDRLADARELPAFRSDECVFSQFPFSARVTAPVLNAQELVLTAVRGVVPENRHFTDDGAPTRNGRPQQVHPTEDVKVHHFKWSRNAIERMRARYLWYRQLHDAGSTAFDFYEEGRRFADYLERHGGRFDLTDPLLDARFDGRCLCVRHPTSVRCRWKGPAPDRQQSWLPVA